MISGKNTLPLDTTGFLNVLCVPRKRQRECVVGGQQTTHAQHGSLHCSLSECSRDVRYRLWFLGVPMPTQYKRAFVQELPSQDVCCLKFCVARHSTLQRGKVPSPSTKSKSPKAHVSMMQQLPPSIAPHRLWSLEFSCLTYLQTPVATLVC